MAELLDIAERWVYEIWQRGKTDQLGDFCDENFTDFSVPSDADSINGLQTAVSDIRAAFPDLKATVADSFEDEDYIILRIAFSGSHESDYHDWAPSRAQIEWEG